MLTKLKSLFRGAGVAQEAPPSGDAAIRMAVAGLLVEAARADETYDAKEAMLIDKALAAQFGIDAQAAADARAEAEHAQAAALDVHQFTKIAKTMAYADRVRLIETMWRIVISDDDRDPHEDALIRRVCGLLYVEDKDSGRARQRAEALGAQ